MPSISKNLERALYEQLYKYFTTNNLFHHSQYGFRGEHSTELAALELIDRATSKMDKELLLQFFSTFQKHSTAYIIKSF